MPLLKVILNQCATDLSGKNVLLQMGRRLPLRFSRLEIHIQFEIFKNFAGRIIVALRLAKDCLALS